MAIAYRPPKVEQVQYAYATLPGECPFNPDDKALVTQEQIIEACDPLIELFNGNELRFTHLTVKEFLSSSASKGVTDKRMTSCLVNVPRHAH